MVRYLMQFNVQGHDQSAAQEIIDEYFNLLQKEGPAGMRSQCYADNENDCRFVHIKSFKKESVANRHFRSAIFKKYIEQLKVLCEQQPFFFRLQQQQTFESIY
ncbi:MAG TPA: hypothetical protein P5158_08575 [Chitinophagaceae bacterium]|nr:hypothetical protein [Chitinophagales bacterium]HRX94156.1 hypothetical protein [Chitinophagaceae bacterium]